MSPDGSIKPPPEEKLLRLIRGKPAPQAARAPAGAGGEVVARRRGPTRNGQWATLAMGALGAVLCLEMTMLLVQALRPLPTVTPPRAAESGDRGASVPAAPSLPSLAASASRPVFVAPAMSSASAGIGGGPVAPPSVAAKTLAARLTLTGVVPGNPAQAIIEDTQTQKTYFVSTGQAVAEGAVVEQVLENRVILDLQGEKIELTL